MTLVTPFIRDKKNTQTGFTLVEMLVVAPLVILLVGVIIGFITTITGDAIATNNRGSVVFSAQQALDMMERDVRLSSSFMASSGAIPTQQRPPSGASTFESSSGYLILEQNGTSNNPYSSDRKLVYYKNQPNPCGATEAVNNSLRVKLIYYLYKESGAQTGTLYKRTIVPSYSPSTSNDEKSACSAPWHANSCTDGFIASSSSPCKVRDEKIATDVSSLGLKYYVNASSSAQTPNPADANSIRIEVKTGNTAAGKVANFTGAVRASKLNPNEAPLQTPVKPKVNTSLTSPTTIKFGWEIPDNMTFYDAKYGINGACTITALSNSRNSSFEVSVNHGDSVTFCLTAKNLVGTSPVEQVTDIVPVWSTVQMENDWLNYSSDFSNFGFTKAHNGEVFLQGLVKHPDPNRDPYMPIATLPLGYRPSTIIIFNTTVYSASNKINADAMIVIRPDGTVVMSVDQVPQLNSWVSLENIKFMPSVATNCAWTNLSKTTGWRNFTGSTGYATPQACVDSTGRGHIQGLVEKTAQSNTPAFNSSILYSTLSKFSTSDNIIVAGRGYRAWAPFGIGIQASSGIQTRFRTYANYTTYASHQADYHTNSYTGTWYPLIRKNGWEDYGSGYTPARCTVNGRIVTINGLIKNGTATDNTVLATIPAGCPNPSKTKIFSGVASAAGEERHARIDIRNNGDIVVIMYGSPTWMSLSDFSYVID